MDPVTMSALISAGVSLFGKKQDAETQKRNFLMQQMQNAQSAYQSAMPSSQSSSSNNFLTSPLFGVGGQ